MPIVRIIDVDRVVATVKKNNEAYQRLVAELRRLSDENKQMSEKLADRSAVDAVEQILEHLGNVTAQIDSEIAALTPPEAGG